MVAGMKRAHYDKKKIAQIKRVLRKFGLSDLITKLNKFPHFYGVLSEDNHRIEIGQGHGEIPPYLMKDIRKQYRYYSNLPLFNHGLTDRPLSIVEYYRIFLGFGAAVKQINTGSSIFPLMEAVRDAIVAMLASSMITVHAVLTRIVLPHSNLAGIGLLTVSQEAAKSSKGEYYRQRLMISIAKPDTKIVERAGRKSKGYEVLFHLTDDHGFKRLSADFNGKQTPCYITAHALKRIEERYDICEPWVARESVFCSVHEHGIEEYDGNLLLPVTVNEEKIGYFVCEAYEGFILITTFLLVTHNGTPEGDMFSKEAHLHRGDITTLHIDTLSSFKRNVLKDDIVLIDLLKNSCLSYLLKLDPKEHRLPPYVDWQTKNGHGEPLFLLNTIMDGSKRAS